MNKIFFSYAPLLLVCSLLSAAKCLAQDDLMKLLEDCVTWSDSKTSVVFIDLNTLSLIPNFKVELSVDPYSVAIRK